MLVVRLHRNHQIAFEGSGHKDAKLWFSGIQLGFSWAVLAHSSSRPRRIKCFCSDPFHYVVLIPACARIHRWSSAMLLLKALSSTCVSVETMPMTSAMTVARLPSTMRDFHVPFPLWSMRNGTSNSIVSDCAISFKKPCWSHTSPLVTIQSPFGLQGTPIDFQGHLLRSSYLRFSYPC